MQNVPKKTVPMSTACIPAGGCRGRTPPVPAVSWPGLALWSVWQQPQYARRLSCTPSAEGTLHPVCMRRVSKINWPQSNAYDFFFKEDKKLYINFLLA